MTRRKKRNKSSSSKKGLSKAPVASESATSFPAQGKVVAVEQQIQTSGPLPPPQILEGYNHVCPGAAERIIAMAEKQAQHRQEMESKALDAGITDAKSDRTQIRRGQFLGSVIALVGVAGGVYAVVQGAGWAGAAIAGAPLVGLVTALIYGRKPKGESENTIKNQ